MNVSQRLKEMATRIFLQYFRYVGIAVVVIILGVGYLMVLGPKIAEVRDVGVSGLRSKQSTLDERRDYLKRLQGMVDAFNKNIAESDVAFLERAIPQGPQIPNLLTVLNDLAIQNGFKVDNINATEQGDETAISATAAAKRKLGTVLDAVRGETTNQVGTKPQGQKLSIRLTLSGPVGYESVRTLLNAVESSERIFDVESLSFNVASSNGGPGQETKNETKYELNINSLYLPDTVNAK